MIDILSPELIEGWRKYWARQLKAENELDIKLNKYFKGDQWTEEQLKSIKEKQMKTMKIVLNYDVGTRVITDKFGIALAQQTPGRVGLEDHELKEPEPDDGLMALEVELMGRLAGGQGFVKIQKVLEEIEGLKGKHEEGVAERVKPLTTHQDLIDSGIVKVPPAMEGEKEPDEYERDSEFLDPEIEEKLTSEEVKQRDSFRVKTGPIGINEKPPTKVDLETLKVLFGTDITVDEIIKLRDSGVI